MVPGRPAWNSPLTLAEFWCTTALLSACAANILSHGAPQAQQAIFYAVAFTVLVAAVKLTRFAVSSVHELRGVWQLLIGVFPRQFAARYLLLAAVLMLVPFSTEAWLRIVLAVAAILGEFFSRYLFFVTVVPTNMAADYLAQEAR